MLIAQPASQLNEPEDGDDDDIADKSPLFFKLA